MIQAIEPIGDPDRPRLIFSTDLAGDELIATLRTPGVLDLLTAEGYGVALALARLDDSAAAAARLLAQHGVAAVACLRLPPEEGFAFNLQNYPRALSSYQAFHTWARQHELRFEAVGLSIEPPLEDVGEERRRRARALARRFWLARENVLYPPAHAAYSELVVAMHLDGYDVHTFQMPVIADDRRAGTTLIQRALDIVDLPADLDVLMCSSIVPIELLGNDLGGALIASYGANADAIGVSSIDELQPLRSRRDGLGRSRLARAGRRAALDAALAGATARPTTGGALHRNGVHPLAGRLRGARSVAEDHRAELGCARPRQAWPVYADCAAARAAVRHAGGRPVRSHHAGLGRLGAGDRALAARAAEAGSDVGVAHIAAVCRTEAQCR